jgi:hypothetical protein
LFRSYTRQGLQHCVPQRPEFTLPGLLHVYQESLLRAPPYPGRTRTRHEHQVAIDVLTKFH